MKKGIIVSNKRKNNISTKGMRLEGENRRFSSSKGIFYSAIVMMLLIPIVMYIVLYIDIGETQREEISTKIKGDKMAGYARSIEDDLPRILDISSKRAIGAAISYIDMNGEPLDRADERLNEMMMNGTIYGSPFGLLGEGSVNEWIYAVETKGLAYGFYTNVTVIELSIKPHNSFGVLLSANLSINISSGVMKINRLYEKNLVISVEGFEDPLYGLKTSGLVKRKFAWINTTIDDIAKLDAAVSYRLYMNSSTGASFLDRLEGNLTTTAKYSSMTPNQIGLETLVYLPELSSVGLPVKSSQTNIDYLYFDSASHAGYPVNGSAYSWFKLDDEHADIYNVELIK